VLAWLRSPGLYRVEAGGSRSVIDMNVGSPGIANLQRSNLPAGSRRTDLLQRVASRPWWEYAVVLACGFLALEWWTWQRRITV
jgi:hypothetical protein